MANYHKIRCCYVTIESIHDKKRYLVPSRDNAEALAHFSNEAKYAKLTASGNFQLDPVLYDDATRFEFCHEGINHYYEPGTPGYDYLASELRGVTRDYDEHRKKYFES